MSDRVEFPQSRCLTGVSSGDITPPVGMYHRMWGAARQDLSTGIHRPLKQITLLIAPPDSDDVAQDGLLFIGLDHCLLGKSDLAGILDPVVESFGIDRSRIVVFFTHNHAAGLLVHDRFTLPGGDQIPGYFSDISKSLVASAAVAIKSAQAATIVYGQGTCNLATHRDYFDEAAQRYVVGFNPDGFADPTVMVGRIHADSDGRTLGTVVNYACHPTTLAWDNTLISPDYIGAMRECVEGATDGPCLFIQGASGDIGPQEGFVGDTAVADRHGRTLGYAALSILESMPQPGRSFQYTGLVESGATIGIWKWQDISDERRQAISQWTAHETILPLSYRPDLPRQSELKNDQEIWTTVLHEAEAANDTERAALARTHLERITRSFFMIEGLTDGDTYPYPIRIWCLGDVIWVALNGEHHNVLQTQLRERFPDRMIIVGTIADGSLVWYLPDRKSYGKDMYQEGVSTLQEGSLETLIAAVGDAIEKIV